MIARRRLLGTATLGTTGALVVSGCQLVGTDEPDRPGTSGPDEDASGAGGAGRTSERPDRDLPLLRQLITAEQEMINAYRATLDAFGDLPGWYRDQLDDHQQHLSALRELATAARESDAEPAPSETRSTPAPPRTPKDAVRSLRKREQATVDARDERLARAHGGMLARLIASIAASDALHRDRISEEGT